jgi:HlyD family secretion protein
MNKKQWIILMVVLAAGAAAIWFWKFRNDEKLFVLQTEHPYIGTLSNTVTATGTIQPVDTVAVGTQVSGTIKNVYVDFNSKVKKGQLLAQLDKSLLEAQLQQITANLQQAKANAVYQKSNFERQSELYKVGAVSKADFETAQYQYQSGNDNVSSIEAQLASAKKNLSYADIYSPIDGTVLSRSVSEGQTVAASFSTPTLFSIARDLTKMQVQAAVDEADIGNVAKGQRVSFSVDAFPNDTFAGTVQEIRLRPTTSSNVVNYTTIINAPNEKMKLKPGMTANITIYTKEVKDIMIIPARALLFKPDTLLAKQFPIEGKIAGNGRKTKRSGLSRRVPSANTSDSSGGTTAKAQVWLKKGNSIVATSITTGMNDETEVQVLGGLQLGDEVVLNYQQVSKDEVKRTDASPFMPRRPQRNKKSSTPPRPQSGG